ncbi:putative exonuclease GOR [Coccinella septempunctata]|uniref:putative exonuclease GOR n=1 Tax=Coccinella septempunctata TaxID=41139 RepID=UPI001D07B48B|nr:putative exonuclease GOR [Coccinella septempunctata]XP_044745130.1 putative exonuclease GOR [Coccinella septempunctata]
MYHPDFSAYGRPAMFFDRRGNLVQPPVWHTPQFVQPPILHPRQQFHQNIPDEATISLHYNNVQQPNVYEVNGTTYYGTANSHMASASANRHHRRPLPEECENVKDEKRIRRHHNDGQRRHSSFFEKQSDAGSPRCPQQQKPLKKKHKKPFPNVYKPIRSARDERPSDCSENKAKEGNNPPRVEAAVSPVFGLTEERLYNLLNQFTVAPEDLFSNGFPQVDKVKNQVRLYKHCFGKPFRIPKRLAGIEEDFDRNSPTAVERTCVRCNDQFFVNENGYLTKQQCFYHWGKISYCRHTCCENTPGSKGCTSSKHHVWNGTVAGINEPLQGFISTKRSKKSERKVFAVDCEMCYTVRGLELCRVTVLGFDGATVYDFFVQPEEEVVDYSTRFSGVTESDVYGAKSKTFQEVQNDLLNIIHEDTILIGHALDNDLRVLKLVHSKIVDTSLIFPHERGFPFRNSLKQLMSVHLNKAIQTSDHGHSPYEDALSCLELIKFKIQLYYAERRLTI